MAVISIN